MDNPLNWPFFDDVHRTFAQRFRQWAASRLSEYRPDDGGDGKAAAAIFRLLGKDGWLENSLPGGGPGAKEGLIDLRAVCLMREILGYEAAIADVSFSEPWLGILPVALFGSGKECSDLVAGYASGGILPAFALSEPDAGSDAAAIAATARPEGDCYVLDGRKTWTSNAGLADVYVVFARTGEGPGAKGLSAFVVDSGLPGISLKERIPVLSPHTVGTLEFNNVRVPSRRLLGKPGQGFSIAMAALEHFRPAVGAAALGMARRAMDEATARSRERRTFQKPLCEHQLIREKLADMAVKTDAMALLVYRAAWRHDLTGAGIAREAAVAKLYATEAAQEVVDQAVQIFGGYGVVAGATVERLYRHIRAFRIFDGASEIQKLIIAGNVLQGARPESTQARSLASDPGQGEGTEKR